MEWLPLAVLGIMWVAFLLPTRGRAPTPQGSVGDFERRMELLAQAESYGTEGRWIVTPRKGVRFMGPTERNRARTRERRRQVFTFLLETIGITFMIGLVPPLRVAWTVTALFAAMLAGNPLPVFALGGMQPAMLAAAQGRGAHGIALMRGW